MLVPSNPFSRKISIAASRIAFLWRARFLRSAGAADVLLAVTPHPSQKLTLASNSIIEKVDALVKFSLSSARAGSSGRTMQLALKEAMQDILAGWRGDLDPEW